MQTLAQQALANTALVSNDAITSIRAVMAAIDRKLTDDVAAVSLLQPKNLDLVSARLGNYTYSDQAHMLFSQAWVK